jgi:murein DD-endopeptidase MepM/ murein hydrolase activator NlpD
VPAHQLQEVSRWPVEPATPAQIDPERFRESVAYLCRRAIGDTPGDEVLASAKEAGVDPFLLAALMFERTRCDGAPAKKKQPGMGLLALEPEMYRGPDAPEVPVHASEWERQSLLGARSNLSVGARLLRFWEDQHKAIDLAFGGVPHRSAVSHFMWGDFVGSSGNEDLVLTTRRRLLVHYEGRRDVPRDSMLGVTVVPPLEASPRVATSGPGDDRDGGKRAHQGLDIAASVGEPVHAMADGVVIFAGANLGKRSPHQAIPAEKITRYTNRRLGTGGIYLCIRHTPVTEADKGVVSCYMHLESYLVATDERVTAGQLIGFVGRTGVQVSPPHLHFEVRVNDKKMNPLRYLADTVIPPRDTLTHVYNIRIKRARLKAQAQRRAALKS